MITPAGSSDVMQIEAASRLDPALLVLLVRINAPTSAPTAWSVWAEHDSALTKLAGRWLAGRPGEDDPASGRWLLTLGMPAPTDASVPSLVLGDGVENHRLTTESIDASLCSPARLAEACGDALDSAGRIRAAGFLADAPRAHAIGCTPHLSERLMTIRDVLRPSLPVSRAEPGVAVAMRLELVIRVDERAFWLVGWVHAEKPADVRLTAISPEGARGVPRREAVTFDVRPGLGRAFGADGIPAVGFSAYVELDSPSHHPTGWVLELRSGAGAAFEDVVRKPVVNDIAEARRRLGMPRISALDDGVLANQILPTVTRLAGRPDSGVVEEIVDYGQVPEAPDVSIVVATLAIDRLEHQILEFASDPQMAGVELIFTIPRARDDGELDALAEGLSSLHRLPFRLVRVSPAALRQRTLNLGASVGRGRLLVLMSGDVLPTARGWLQVAREFHDANPAIGIVGPRLLHEDGSIASAGSTYVRDRRSRGWKRESPLRGLAPTLVAATKPRMVDAVSEACLMVAADRFRAHGGLCELYLEDGDVAGDLCLSLAESGLETWYLPDSTLHLLERDTWPAGSSSVTQVFNDWLFASRWGKRLAASAGDSDGPDRVATRAPAPMPPIFPSAGSARPGAPVEILEIIPAELDGSQVLDGALVLPQTSDARSPYEDTYSFAIDGWAIPRGGGPLEVEMHGGSMAPRRTLANLPRAHAGGRYPDLPGADTSGFQFVIGSLSLPVEFELEVDVVSGDGTRTAVGRVRGRRRPLRSGYSPAIQPLLLTTLGRSGSMWLLMLLSKHPEIAVCQPFQYEAVLASYWMEVLNTLAEPTSYMRILRPERLYERYWWIGDQRQSPLPLRVSDSEMPRWLACENVEVIAGFCQSRFDAFYQEVARQENRGVPRYFAEKSEPGSTPRTIGELYADSREIFLVRDLRDWVCSILDYNMKRGFERWGRDKVDTDEEWFCYLRTEARGLLNDWRERSGRAHLVRYEDLIGDPAATLAAVFSYLGLDGGAGTVRQALEDARRTSPNAQALHQTSTSVEASTGRWKRDLAPEHKALCAEAFDDILLEFGYEVAGAPPSTAVSGEDRPAAQS